MNPEEEEFIDYENEATVSLTYCIPIVPGLLQTPQYIDSLLLKLFPDDSEREHERKVQYRLRRQQNLRDRPDRDPLELRVILHESCLTQSVGSADALRDQLNFLQTASKTENIDIRVLPSTADPHPAIANIFSHFAFGEDIDRDVVFLETSAGLRYIEDDTTVRRFERWFSELARRSLDPAMSIARIRDAITGL